MQTINLSELRSAVADAKLAGHVVTKDTAVRMDAAKVGKSPASPSRD